MKVCFQLPKNEFLDMPKGAKVLSAQSQGDNICLWAMVDPSEVSENRHFVVIGTGHDVPELHLVFIDTVQLFGGSLIFHVFEVLG